MGNAWGRDRKPTPKTGQGRFPQLKTRQNNSRYYKRTNLDLCVLDDQDEGALVNLLRHLVDKRRYETTQDDDADE